MRRGFTVVEALITCAVMSLLLVMMFQVIVPGMNLMQQGSMRASVQQQAMMITQQIFTELQRSTPKGVSIHVPASATDPAIIGVNSIGGILPTGYPQFEDRLHVFWHDIARRRVRRKVYPPTPPALPGFVFDMKTARDATSSQLQSIIGQSNGTERNVSSDVDLFRLEVEPTTGGEVYVLYLGLNEDVPRQNENRLRAKFYCKRKLFLRNHDTLPPP